MSERRNRRPQGRQRIHIRILGRLRGGVFRIRAPARRPRLGGLGFSGALGPGLGGQDPRLGGQVEALLGRIHARFHADAIEIGGGLHGGVDRQRETDLGVFQRRGGYDLKRHADGMSPRRDKGELLFCRQRGRIEVPASAHLHGPDRLGVVDRRRIPVRQGRDLLGGHQSGRTLRRRRRPAIMRVQTLVMG